MAQDYVKGLLSGGEVVLVDTRQHWMAAIRFALKPIVLILGIILLALLNNWLQFSGGLSFINDIVTWILLIGVIIAVIWLPIDLVRWWSRRYVLTSRRAMRMEGVLRKKSFDSSLEQINDIGFAQSLLGRTLGYADLTLYTASDTANETYEQLMDGLQFKKAVLDAKEGLRQGTPLQGLPAGFIVKGGTNEASMRADGKIQEAAAQSSDAPPAAGSAAPPSAAPADEPAPSAPSTATAAPPPAPEPVAEPALVVDPEPEAAPADEPPAAEDTKESSTSSEEDRPA